MLHVQLQLRIPLVAKKIRFSEKENITKASDIKARIWVIADDYKSSFIL